MAKKTQIQMSQYWWGVHWIRRTNKKVGKRVRVKESQMNGELTNHQRGLSDANVHIKKMRQSFFSTEGRKRHQWQAAKANKAQIKA